MAVSLQFSLYWRSPALSLHFSSMVAYAYASSCALCVYKWTCVRARSNCPHSPVWHYNLLYVSLKKTNDEPLKQCYALRNDYLECLHHKKEVNRFRSFLFFVDTILEERHVDFMCPFESEGASSRIFIALNILFCIMHVCLCYFIKVGRKVAIKEQETINANEKAAGSHGGGGGGHH